MTLRAPYPWPGGKSRAASIVWEALGNPACFVEPFAGSLAVLLARPDAPRVEIANDLDGNVINFWRALTVEPDHLARLCDAPVHEADLVARERRLIDGRVERLEHLFADDTWFDLGAAAHWVHGVCASIAGSAYGTGNKPRRQIPNLARGSVGIHRLVWESTRGPEDSRTPFANVRAWFEALAARIRHVRFACGDWRRVCSDAVLLTPLSSYARDEVTGVFLDPEYARSAVRYGATCDSADVRAWAIEHGEDPRLRIVLAGEAGEHLMPAGWLCVSWRRKGGMGDAQNDNNKTRDLERLWISPHCRGARQTELFGSAS